MVLIKSMARKQPSFGQLLRYFDHERHAGDKRFTHNCLSVATNRDGLVAELEYNATFLKNRSNGNYLYHEIVALPAGLDVSKAYQQRALLALTKEYIRRRAPHQMVVGKLHCQTDHLHCHLAISANEVQGKKRCWMRKTDLSRIQMEVERYANQHFPDLGLHEHYQKVYRQKIERIVPKIKTRENALKQRTGLPSQKERDHHMIKAIFAKAKSERALQNSLHRTGFELYRRGRTEGVIHQSSGRKYRLKTLGLEQDLITSRRRIQVFEQRQSQLEAWQDQSHQPERGRDA